MPFNLAHLDEEDTTIALNLYGLMAYSLFFLMVHYRTVQKPLSIAFVFQKKSNTMKKMISWHELVGLFENPRAEPTNILVFFYNIYWLFINQNAQVAPLERHKTGNVNDLGSIPGLPSFQLLFFN